MNALLIFFACYLAVALVTNALAIRYRTELVTKVAKAKRIDGLSDRQIATLDSYVLSMRSLRTSVILFLIFWQLLLMPKDHLVNGSEIPATERPLWESGLMHRILELHLASAAAANPIFGALAYAMRWAVHFRFKQLCGDTGEQQELRSVNARYAAC